MIRWREDTECFRVSVSRPGDVVAQFLFAGVYFLIAAVFFLQMAAFTSQWVIYLIVGPVLIGLGAVSVVVGIRYIQHRGWVEVPVRGGPIRWWHVGLSSPQGPAPVWGFLPEGDKKGQSWVVAVVKDGTEVRVFGNWGYRDHRKVTKLIDRLNEVVG